MINPYKILSVNHNDVVVDKEYDRSLDLVELITRINSLNNQLVEANIRLKKLQSENKCLKQQIIEFRAILKERR